MLSSSRVGAFSRFLLSVAYTLLTLHTHWYRHSLTAGVSPFHSVFLTFHIPTSNLGPSLQQMPPNLSRICLLSSIFKFRFCFPNRYCPGRLGDPKVCVILRLISRLPRDRNEPSFFLLKLPDAFHRPVLSILLTSKFLPSLYFAFSSPETHQHRSNYGRCSNRS